MAHGAAFNDDGAWALIAIILVLLIVVVLVGAVMVIHKLLRQPSAITPSSPDENQN